MQSAILLLPDENREVLQTLLFFLSDIASKKGDNQMTEHNLAVCFAQTLFQLHLTPSSKNFASQLSTRLSRRRSFDSKKSHVIPGNEQFLSESVAAVDCFTFMIEGKESYIDKCQELSI